MATALWRLRGDEEGLDVEVKVFDASKEGRKRAIMRCLPLPAHPVPFGRRNEGPKSRDPGLEHI